MISFGKKGNGIVQYAAPWRIGNPFLNNRENEQYFVAKWPGFSMTILVVSKIFSCLKRKLFQIKLKQFFQRFSRGQGQVCLAKLGHYATNVFTQ